MFVDYPCSPGVKRMSEDLNVTWKLIITIDEFFDVCPDYAA
jgi:hypothetical protein